MEEVKELPLEFIGRGEVKGFVFKQLKKSENAYLYEVHPSPGNAGRSPHYEVFKRKINRRFNQVSYPKAKDFGVWAWTPQILEKAEKLFAELSYPAKR